MTSIVHLNEEKQTILSKPKKQKHDQKKKFCFTQTLKEKLPTSIVWSNNLEQDLPTKWEIIGNLILLPANCFRQPIWENTGEKIKWICVITLLNIYLYYLETSYHIVSMSQVLFLL